MPELYLSRLQLRPQPPPERRLLADPYSRHRFVCRLFPWTFAQGRPLYRLDGRDLLMQSPLQPDRSALLADQQLETRRFSPELAVDRLLSFRLLAAPARREKVSRRLVALIRPEELAGWLARKGAAGGFAVLEQCVARRELCAVRRYEDEDAPGKGELLTFNAAEYRGVLRVTDSAAFAQTLANGCGRGKAFGFGLLSVVPYRA